MLSPGRRPAVGCTFQGGRWTTTTGSIRALLAGLLVVASACAHGGKAREAEAKTQSPAAQAASEAQRAQRNAAQADQQLAEARQRLDAVNRDALAAEQQRAQARQQLAAAEQRATEAQRRIAEEQARGLRVTAGRVIETSPSRVTVATEDGRTASFRIDPGTRVLVGSQQRSVAELQRGAEARVACDAAGTSRRPSST